MSEDDGEGGGGDGKGCGRGGIRLLRICSAVLVGLGLWPMGFGASFVPPMRGMRGVMRRIGTRGARVSQ